MNAYGAILKKLIRFTNIKLTNLAEIVGYDTSYISKWCNKEKLPASKAAANVNKCLAGVFASEIFAQEETEVFASEFEVSLPKSEDELKEQILHMLKDAYKSAYNNSVDVTRPLPVNNYRVLIWQQDIDNFFSKEFPKIITGIGHDTDIYCTVDILKFIKTAAHLPSFDSESDFQVNVKCGFNMNARDDEKHYIYDLYRLINLYPNVCFDFYCNDMMREMNLIIVKDVIAVQCSLDSDGRFSLLTVITDAEQVNAIYHKVVPSYVRNKILIHGSDSDELFYNGYRTEFYSRNSFQILITKGFEFLLQPEINPRLIKASVDQGFNATMQQIIAQLGITWEEIFEKGHIDFYLPKTSLLQYVTDGLIYFADVPYTMSKEERKGHMESVLNIVSNNPNIFFHIIDDEIIPNGKDLMKINVYNNHKKLFLKNTYRYKHPTGPRFYMVQDARIIEDISSYFESLKGKNFCNTYDADRVGRFYETYGNMIQRMLELGE